MNKKLLTVAIIGLGGYYLISQGAGAQNQPSLFGGGGYAYPYGSGELVSDMPSTSGGIDGGSTTGGNIPLIPAINFYEAETSNPFVNNPYGTTTTTTTKKDEAVTSADTFGGGKSGGAGVGLGAGQTYAQLEKVKELEKTVSSKKAVVSNLMGITSQGISTYNKVAVAVPGIPQTSTIKSIVNNVTSKITSIFKRRR